MEDLPKEFLLEGLVVKVQFLAINTREITAGSYLLSIVEVVISVQQQIGTGALLVVKAYTFYP